jgi:hypothetical protein
MSSSVSNSNVLQLTIQRERDDRVRRYDIVLEAGPLETPPMLSPLAGQGGTNGSGNNRRAPVEH